MHRKRLVGLSAGEAVLGLVIEQPDTASRLGSRLVERFRSAQFTRSTAHNALGRLARQGLVRVAADEGGPEERRYEATPLGVEHFRAWLRACSAAAPALREELHAKVEFCTSADLPQLLEAICAEERACASMFAVAQGRLSETELLAPRRSTAEERWAALTRRAVLRDEAALWGMRFKRLERLRARLEELGEVAAEPLEEPAREVAEEPVRLREEELREAAVAPVLARLTDPVREVASERARSAAGEPVLGHCAPARGTKPRAHARGGHPTHVDDPPR